MYPKIYILKLWFCVIRANLKFNIFSSGIAKNEWIVIIHFGRKCFLLSKS